MQHGVILKTYNSFYYVKTNDKVIMCTLRGRFKKERFSLLVGDEVEYDITENDKGIIEKILPRRSMLKRPMIANIDQVIVTFAAVNPNINAVLVDRFLVLAEMSDLDIIICINKTDLADMQELEPLLALYRSIGYKVITLSAKLGLGIRELQNALSDKISVFAGPSGAGKSTILNTIEAGLTLVTGEVSEKIGRGKHTTRFAELLPLTTGGFVVDTPGFSFTEFDDVKKNDLMYYFPEIAAIVQECKFNTCLHVKEPQCAIKQAVLEGRINEQRYNSYIEILSEIQEKKKGF
ncbi:ribosome small subunit-dependent GTPase A [Pelosinus sp. IPA-1]|uniref:ribosome small subunit-dependent GTPase A n=1 Tax=Pelosinus sp. IPA-1 TaxID=3029569 RepID=UPI00243617A6|nr:ribosome small subunit-dependent GTPase A [Pelosinus sp. IPA-1]GMA99637.1 putative ribosome biogenesis GTPase RsgA [Pelosinus sp. IPA-1]